MASHQFRPFLLGHRPPNQLCSSPTMTGSSARGRAARAPVSVIVQGGVSPTQIEPFRFVPDRNCVAVRRGGEQRQGNGRPAGNEHDSAECIGEPASLWRSPYPLWRNDLFPRASKHGKRAGGRKDRLRGAGAYGGWWQDVRTHECVKLGYPDAVREPSGSQSLHSSDETP